MTNAQPKVRGERGRPIVETAGLRKTFRSRRRKVVAVEGLDLTVTSGGIHGYLGPNGSGKTTTIRMLLGLIRPDSGTMSLFGQPVPKGLPRTINRIGAVVEQPRLFPGMSGRDNLRLLTVAGGIDERRVGEVLELVGLRERAADRVKGYSLGMKQRLALAATLLRDPDLLILDEPTNGLDPAGIREIRELMRSLADQGVTILVSSHILSELQQSSTTSRSSTGEGSWPPGRWNRSSGRAAAGSTSPSPIPTGPRRSSPARDSSSFAITSRCW